MLEVFLLPFSLSSALMLINHGDNGFDLPDVEQLAHDPSEMSIKQKGSKNTHLDASNPSSLNLDNVNQQAGYLKVPSGNELFYWFFESRDNPANDPVLVWMNGGPGCSSLEAVLFENGPVNIDQQNRLNHNPFSWNSFANVLYIDNPAGVGYSRAVVPISDTPSASADFKAAIAEFFKQNPQFAKNKFHISGESYAGRYIPVFAAAINEDNSMPVKVSSVLIGNGLVDPISEFESYQPMMCGQGGYPQQLNELDCQRLQYTSLYCVNAMRECMNTLDQFQCQTARARCAPLESSFAGRNPYDIRDSQCTASDTNLCYPLLDNVQSYFRSPDVQRALGVTLDNPNSFQICNSRITNRFYSTDDPFAPTFHNVTNLLAQGTAVLAYHGDADIVLNWLSGLQWTASLEWPGQTGFINATKNPQEWKPDGSDGLKRGEVYNYENLTFLRVADAGHMVPHDQPIAAAEMVKSWLKGDYKFGAQNADSRPPVKEWVQE